MNDLLVYLSAAGYALFIFPVHIVNYVYVDTNEKYLCLNVCAYRFIRLFNVNSVKDKPMTMQVNGKDKQVDFSHVKKNAFGVLARLHVCKIVQLCDFGLLSDYSAYAALLHRAISTAAYGVLRYGGSYAKLKNYTVLNQSNGGVRYYAKAETAVNLLNVSNIILYLIAEKIK